MKKLMIAAAIVCVAAISQAASVTWGVSGMVLPGTNGAYADGAAGLAKITMSVYLITGDDAATTFAGLTADNIYSTYNGKTADYTGKTSMGNKTFEASGYESGDNVYAAILFTYTDDKGKQWYVANKAQATIAESLGVAQDAEIKGLNTKFGGTTDAVNFGGDFGTAINGWTAVAVPEPTSGLLLLLGVAGLALKRKRA